MEKGPRPSRAAAPEEVFFTSETRWNSYPEPMRVPAGRPGRKG
jgi:hypothetical protein